MKLQEKEVIRLEVKRLLTEVSYSKKLVAGKIVGVVVYNTNIEKANGQVENLEIQIKQQNSTKVVELQPIKNLRSREAAYSDSFVPVDFEGGQEITIDIYNRVPFQNDDVNVYVIFIYDTTETNEKRFC